jgi:tRNA(fMet)-specific endonuclease VapC
MSLFVLDTDSLSLYQRSHRAVLAQIQAHLEQSIAITVITVEEQLTGWYRRLRKAKNPRELAGAYQRLAAAIPLLARWPILSFTEPAIARFKQLKALKLNVSSMDLSIAAITLENGGILVTRNRRDFQRVPGLPLEDWSV